jgi:hypothetical protein
MLSARPTTGAMGCPASKGLNDLEKLEQYGRLHKF